MAGTVTVVTQQHKGKGLHRVNVALTCASGAVSAASIGQLWGKLIGIYMDPVAGAGATMTSTADVLITDALTGASLTADLSFGAAANWYRPTKNVVDSAGATITAATSAADVMRPFYLAGNTNVAIANATTTDTGLLCLLVDES
jgi:uncharacterized membrane protein